jgi:hypothetical protein
MPKYNIMLPADKPVVRNVFRSMLAALMVALNIPRAFPNTVSVTVTIPKLTSGGANGSLTFTDGMLTAKTDPT